MKNKYMMTLGGILLILLLGWAVYVYVTPSTKSVPSSQSAKTSSMPNTSTETKDMLIAGGCFWCVEADMEKVEGVQRAVSGYAGGENENPTYENYAVNGHREVVNVVYDPEIVSYGQLLYYFLKHIDPTDGNGQFSDRGEEYAPAIYYETEEEKRIAEEVLKDIDAAAHFQNPLEVPLLEKTQFWEAEEYHQDYYKKNSFRYGLYRKSSGRTAYIRQTWGRKSDVLPDYRAYQSDKQEEQAENREDKPWQNFEKPDKATLKQELTDIQYRVTQNDATEEPFNNAYWDNDKPGIYVDVVSGEPLFSSKNKFKSGTGWPSFTKPLEPDNVVTKSDFSFFIKRTEVRSKYADSHLGHVFEDGPKKPEQTKAEEATGLRYCLNSAALEFISADQLEERGYGEYTELFEKE